MRQNHQGQREKRRRVSADLIERIATETAALNNRRAWLAILDRLVAAGVSRRDATKQRDVVWMARKQNVNARRQAERLGGNANRLRMNPT
jgi:hypothetical protein